MEEGTCGYWNTAARTSAGAEIHCWVDPTQMFMGWAHEFV